MSSFRSYFRLHNNIILYYIIQVKYLSLSRGKKSRRNSVIIVNYCINKTHHGNGNQQYYISLYIKHQYNICYTRESPIGRCVFVTGFIFSHDKSFRIKLILGPIPSNKSMAGRRVKEDSRATNAKIMINEQIFGPGP